MTLKSLVEIDEIPMDTEVLNGYGLIATMIIGYRVGVNGFHVEG